jgi:DNA polymerase
MNLQQNKALLEWYVAAGVDETIDDAPTNVILSEAQRAQPKDLNMAEKDPSTPSLRDSAQDDKKIPLQTQAYTAPSEAATVSRALADKCTTIDELEAAIRGFDGCAIKKTASKTVFADGNRQAKILLIGEAPGYQEDVQGIPFCGPSGQLLDKMLASIGLDRTKVLISNTVYWRPPGNRQPNQEETAICLPFVEKLVGLLQPSLLILSGGTATHAVLKKDQSISRLRGKFYDYSNPYLEKPVKAALLFHPSYLLRQPLQKRLAWADLQMMQKYLSSKDLTN